MFLASQKANGYRISVMHVPFGDECNEVFQLAIESNIIDDADTI